MAKDVDPIFAITLGPGPLVASAIHDGHVVRPELEPYLAISEADRLREEDPYTGRWTEVAPTRILGLRSRFEVDLNRPREGAIYRTPEQAWGLRVWKDEVPPDLWERSLAQYDAFYEAMKELLDRTVQECGGFVLLDLHSYNHRRDGPEAAPADPQGNPQINVGTATVDARRWGAVVDRFTEALRDAPFPGGPLDVRSNVKFRGGYWPRWVNGNYGHCAVALAVEVKKFFMDEWTGKPDDQLIAAIGQALKRAAEAAVQAWQERV